MKYLVLIPDGMADVSVPQLDGLTPMQKANKPCMNALAKESLVGMVSNVPEGMVAEIINANLTVRVRGPEEELNMLTEKDITAVVDLSAAEVGTATYKATIVISDEYPNVGAMKTSSVSATVLPKEG